MTWWYQHHALRSRLGYLRHSISNITSSKFPAEYLALFSVRYKSPKWDDNIKSITLIGGDKAVYKQIFDWIKQIFDWIQQSGDQGSAVDVPQFVESTPQVFKAWAAVQAATAKGTQGAGLKQNMFVGCPLPPDPH